MTRGSVGTVVVLFVLATVCVGAAACNGSPTEPRISCVDQRVVLASEPAYIARSESLTTAPGRLRKDCQSNARYCYYLGEVRVYTLGNQTVLDDFVGDDVLIVGKAVFPAEGPPGELWAGTICRITR